MKGVGAGFEEPERIKLAEFALDVTLNPGVAVPADEAQQFLNREDGGFAPPTGAAVIASFYHLLGCEPGPQLAEGDVAFLVAPPDQGELMGLNGPVSAFDPLGIVPWGWFLAAIASVSGVGGCQCGVCAWQKSSGVVAL